METRTLDPSQHELVPVIYARACKLCLGATVLHSRVPRIIGGHLRGDYTETHRECPRCEGEGIEP